MLLTYLLIFCRLVIGLTFALSFVTKATNLKSFEETVANFRVLPKKLNTPFSLLSLIGELAVVIFTAPGGHLLWLSFALAILLLLVFSLGLINVLARNINTSCSCFGSSDKPVTRADLWRNAGLMALAVIGLLLNNQMAGSLSAASLVIVGLFALAFTAIWVNLGEIVEAFKEAGFLRGRDV